MEVADRTCDPIVATPAVSLPTATISVDHILLIGLY